MGITPAYAGTTIDVNFSSSLAGDHPRLRGNYLFYSIHILPLMGSPPLTRELHRLAHLLEFGHGITPAYAGTTSGAVSILSADQDHPRLRGNYSLINFVNLCFRGSPPLTRELHLKIPYFSLLFIQISIKII